MSWFRAPCAQSLVLVVGTVNIHDGDFCPARSRKTELQSGQERGSLGDTLETLPTQNALLVKYFKICSVFQFGVTVNIVIVKGTAYRKILG